MWPDVDGTVTPLYLAKKSIYYLPQFKWYEALRPKDKDDIFNVPPEMEALLKSLTPGKAQARQLICVCGNQNNSIQCLTIGFPLLTE